MDLNPWNVSINVVPVFEKNWNKEVDIQENNAFQEINVIGVDSVSYIHVCDE